MIRNTSFFLFSCLAFQVLMAQNQSGKYKADYLQGEYVSRTEEKDKFLKNDFSKLWTTTENQNVLGIIGTNYQRFHIKFITVTKDINNPSTYIVTGKDKVKTNICDFTGTIKILHIRKSSEFDDIVDDTMRNYCILAAYSFKENPKQQFTGTFEGIAQCNFYLDLKGNIHYYDITDNEEFSNNGFVGTWKSYDGKYNKPCNWGDLRIPYSGDLDNGAAYFYPADKYQKNGWLNYVASLEYNTAASVKALQAEKMAWWR